MFATKGHGKNFSSVDFSCFWVTGLNLASCSNGHVNVTQLGVSLCWAVCSSRSLPNYSGSCGGGRDLERFRVSAASHCTICY